ncbi:adenosylcobinamide-phosphate synthase [hydrocarbon metagenome]|uniref:Adenosylcobinamide-phosphate synthase n=1 Tax=hydrocarbon metagenome TaxID=938273 RepID=A0A0W8EAM4_9ZZZZ
MEYLMAAAVVLDLVIGDPRILPHPVVYMGKAIRWQEKLIRRYARTQTALRIAGIFLWLSIVGGTYLFFGAIIWLAYKFNPYLAVFISVFLMSQALAVNSLYKHAAAVVKPLKQGDIVSAGQALSMIVGRDTEQLNEKDILRAVVETVAENTVDGITAPMFYGFIGGPPLALAYKAVNTLDSMVGYKDENYIDLGWASARLDDLANYIPARITGLLYLLIAPITPGGFRNVFKTIQNDARRHPSPNSGIPEAAVAGALTVQLGGVNYYAGIESNRPLIGESQKSIEISDVNWSLLLMFMVSLAMLLLGSVISVLLK